MKINAKIISEKVDHYIDLMLECESEEPDQNEIISGDEPEEGEKQKSKIIDDLVDEELQVLHDEDIDSEEDLNDEDGETPEKDLNVTDEKNPDEDDIDESAIGTMLKKLMQSKAEKAAEEAAKRKKMFKTIKTGVETRLNTNY